MSGTFHELAERIKRRGLIVVISDFLPPEDCVGQAKRRDHVDRVLSGLRHFRHRKHEVVVFHVLDPRERDLFYDRETRFVGLEQGAEVATEPWHIAEEYRRHMSDEVDRYRRECREVWSTMFRSTRRSLSTPFCSTIWASGKNWVELCQIESRNRTG